MVKAIRTVRLSASDEGSLATWETAVTPQNFMPRTADQINFMNDLRERKAMARGNRTMDNLEKEKKSEVTRLPPTTMEEAQKGLCTYSHFLDMAGFRNSSHYEGVMEIRKALNELSTRKETIQPVFYMSVMWVVTDDQCKHFSKCTDMDDFEGGCDIVWPTTSLVRFAERMRDSEKIDLIDLLQKWRTWLARKSNPWSVEQGGGRGRSGRNGQPGQGQPPPQQTGGGPAGG